MSKSLEIIVDSSKDQVVFAGSTYLLKDRIKALPGARWNFKEKFWYAPLSENRVESLLASFPGATIIDLGKPKIEDENSEQESYLGVSSLINNLKSFFDRAFPDDFKVCGVVRGLKNLPQGRVYFDLYDLDNPSIFIRSVIWENRSSYIAQLKKDDFVLENDLPILVSGRVSFSPTNAILSLVINKIFPEFTKGKLAAEREKTNSRLKQEGVFSQNRSVELKTLPVNLGVLTSKGGTVINDFMSSLSDSQFGFKLFWYPVHVQGQSAINDLLRGLTYFNQRDDIDAILVFRGGGSVSDLQIFNNYELAKAACLSVKPIISAIGHEFDQSSFQDVSHLSFGVPKDIGHFLSNRIKELRDSIEECKVNIFQFIGVILERKQSEVALKIDQLKSKCVLAVGEYRNKTLNLQHEIFKRSSDTFSKFSANFNKSCGMIKSLSSYVVDKSNDALVEKFYNLQSSARYLNLGKRKLLQDLASPLVVYANRGLEDNFKLLEGLELVFKMISPELQLQRGFAIVRKDSKIITSKSEVEVNGDLLIEMHDGQVRTKVTEVK